LVSPSLPPRTTNMRCFPRQLTTAMARCCQPARGRHDTPDRNRHNMCSRENSCCQHQPYSGCGDETRHRRHRKSRLRHRTGSRGAGQCAQHRTRQSHAQNRRSGCDRPTLRYAARPEGRHY
jgi:hypothetical protein